MKLTSKHLLTGAELSAAEISDLLNLAAKIKFDKKNYSHKLQHKNLALIFEKPSLRTRLSFTVAMQQLGGNVIESVSNTRKTEEPEDQMRVLQGYCDAIMVRTFADSILQRMQSVATIPIINGLTNDFHPCQTLADLLTIQEIFPVLSGVKICYIGDGNNILHSLLIMAPKLGIDVHYCTPAGHEPQAEIVKMANAQAQTGTTIAFATPEQAVENCHAVYTDVWTSMGFSARDENVFAGFQVNEQLMSYARPNAIFLHCMPMERGKEVSATLPDQPYSAIFKQSENRLHVQKALLLSLLAEF